MNNIVKPTILFTQDSKTWYIDNIIFLMALISHGTMHCLKQYNQLLCNYQESSVLLNFEMHACNTSRGGGVTCHVHLYTLVKFFTHTCSDISLSFMTDFISLEVFPLAPATTIASAVLMDIGDMNTF